MEKEFYKNQDAFTLIEIVLVITILGILISLFMPNFGKTQLTARVTAHNANVKMLKSAVALYLLDNPLEVGGLIEESEIKPYLDENVDFKVDSVIAKQLGSEGVSISIRVNDKGDIDIFPGEVRINGDKIELINREDIDG